MISNSKSTYWVHGFKYTQSMKNWFEDVVSVILSNFEKIPRRSKTTSAELGFGIPPSFYSYIGKAHNAYGNGIFFFIVSTDDWDLNDKGACPFDTGGFWNGHIKTSPSIDTASDKRHFFNQHDKPLNDWLNIFRKYISSNYSDHSKYIQGIPPDIGAGIESIIKANPPNDDRAWTWEGRFPVEKINGQVKIAYFFCKFEKRTGIIRSIRKLRLNLKDKKIILKFLKSTKTKTWMGPESPVGIASEILHSEGII